MLRFTTGISKNNTRFASSSTTETSKSTGLFGIDKHPDPKPTLLALYRRTLNVVSRFPQESFYRETVETLTKTRLEALETAKTMSEFEQKIDCGIVEEIIIQAEEELKLIEIMEKHTNS
jgi:NADH dehydrogenase (ubiquinone) 1 alpha subcomplex subunit 5